MSFSSDVKEELTQLVPDNDCCAVAQCYGMLECGHAFSGSAVSLLTENAAVAAAYRAHILTICGVDKTAVEHCVRSSGFHLMSVSSQENRTRVLERFGHSPMDVTNRLNRANLECDACPAAYLRGAFLSCGTVTDPQNAYHMEFSVAYYNLSRDIMTLMRELGFNARAVRRKGNHVIYIKESEQIEDCLTLMGAPNAALEMMNVSIVKNVRNTANRLTNCESANLDKTIAASLAQAEAIRRIEEQQRWDGLPEELRELARLRLDNPDLSLRELGEMLSQPLSRSGVNHRLQRILDFAAKLQ